MGLLNDVRHTGLDKDPLPEFYVSAGQANLRVPPGVYFAVRTTAQPASIIASVRRVVQQLDPQLAVNNIATMEQQLSGSVARPRFYAVTLGMFAVVAVLLAAIGIGGIMAYSVSHSTREIGIRIALGAEPWAILALVLRQAIVLSLIGIGVGLIGAVALARYLTALLFGLTPLDPMTFVVASAIFAFVSILSCYLPARRATSVDPLVALRYE